MLKYNFSAVSDEPCFDISPHSARMSTCYIDHTGVYHLFIDYIDAYLQTLHSWAAEIYRYDSTDLKNWTFHSVAVARGLQADPDGYGAGSPYIVCHQNTAYLFYAGRSKPVGDEQVDSLAAPGEIGYVAGRICLATAPLNTSGAPCAPFLKKGVVIDNIRPWCAMRVDDPGCIIFDNVMHLYYKGFYKYSPGQPIPNNMSRSGMVFSLGHASSLVSNLNFVVDQNPIFAVDGGLEMPRVFMAEGKIQMFLRHFRVEPGKQSLWGHYAADDFVTFSPVNLQLFDGVMFEGKNISQAADIMLIYDADGNATDKALACGVHEGVLKLWLYRIDVSGG
jgi:hypothetical protein